MTTIKLATCNAKKELRGTDPAKVIDLAASKADIIVWQEIETKAHKDAIHALGRTGAWATYWPGGSANAVPISWRTDRFDLLHSNRLKVASGVFKVNPTRWTTHVALLEKASKIKVGVQNTHLISQAFTSHPGRKGRWVRGAGWVSGKSAAIVEADGRLIGGGDMNRDKWTPVGTTGAWAVKGTVGSQHYDTIFYAGQVAIIGKPVRYAAGNPSDHDLLVATFNLNPKTPTKPPTSGSRTPTADKVIKVALSQVGYHEGKSGNTWTNEQKYSLGVPGLKWSNFQAWCATFVSWCALEAGVAKLFPSTASTDAGAAWFKKAKRWSEYPAIGAQVFYGRNGDMNHTGIVVSYTAKTITTVEGNTNTTGSPQGDGVYRLTHDRFVDRIQGYGYPAYPEGIVSADPAWADRAPKEK